MKKWVLFLMVLMSFSCLGNIQGMAAVCPAERPLLDGGVWKNENCPKFEIPAFSGLFLLNAPHWAELSFDGVCNPDHCVDEDTKVLCQGLVEFNKTLVDLKQELEENYRYDYYHRRYNYEYYLVKSMRELCEKKSENCSKLRELADKLNEIGGKILQLEREIPEYNSEIVEVNQIIGEKNGKVATYHNHCQIEADILKDQSPIDSGFWGYEEPFIIPRKKQSPSDLLNQCEKKLEYVIQERSREIEDIERQMDDYQRENLRRVFRNIKEEKANYATIFEFEKFYTSEKEKQLLKEYEKALSEKCVGCDYPKALSVQKESCDLCSNREYVDGKCILKRSKK